MVVKIKEVYSDFCSATLKFACIPLVFAPLKASA